MAWQPETRIEMFFARISPEPNSGCWLWTGKVAARRGGYAVFSIGPPGRRKYVKVSRWAYQTFVGPLADDLDACHKCDVPPCVNPSHIFPGTKAENMADKVRKGRHHNSMKTHCRHGHPLGAPDAHGHRSCAICVSATKRRYKARKRMERAA